MNRIRRDPRLTHAVGLLAILATVIGSWRLLYVPATRRLEAARTHLSSLRQQVAQLEAMLAQAGGAPEWLARQQDVLSELTRRIPPSREVPGLLDRLLEQAGVNDLKVVDVNQGNLEPATDAEGSPILAGDIPCLALPVTVTADGSFRNAVAFLEEISGAGLPALVTVKRVRMKTHHPLNATLRMTVQVVLYAVSS